MKSPRFFPFILSITSVLFLLISSVFSETAEILNPSRGTNVLYIVPPGTSVEKGSVVAVLDPSPAIDEIKRQETALADLRTALDKKKQQIALIDPASAADIIVKKEALARAEADFQEYTVADAIIEEQTLTQTLNNATSALAQEQTRYEARDKMLAEGFIQKSEWEQQAERVKSCKLTASIAQARLDKFTKFVKPRRLRDLQAAIDTLKTSIAQIPINAEKSKAALSADVDSLTKQIAAADKLLVSNRETLKTGIVLTAPTSGKFTPGPAPLTGTLTSPHP